MIGLSAMLVLSGNVAISDCDLQCYKGLTLHDMSRSDLSCAGLTQTKHKMNLAEIKQFLSVRASFAGHIRHANSYNLSQKTGALDETDPFEYDRA
jgi:hypothetical protein